MSNEKQWTIHYHRDIDKEIRRLPKHYVKRILDSLDNLAFDPRPHGSIKITGHDLWRLSVGVYRILYNIDDDNCLVSIYRIGHRREVYRNL